MMNVTARYGSSRGSGWPLPVGLLTIVSGLFTGMSVVTLTGSMSCTIDVPTARWRAKTLEYPPSDLSGLDGPGWPWGATLLPFLYALGGAAAMMAVRAALAVALRRRRARSGPPSAATVRRPLVDVRSAR